MLLDLVQKAIVIIVGLVLVGALATMFIRRKNINRTEKTRSEEEKTDTAERKIEEDTLWGSPQVIRKAREHTTVYECRTGYHSHMRCEDKDEKAENKEDIFLGAMSERRFVLDKSFAELLFVMIDRSGMSDVECYKRANVDRKTFSKIKCNKAYRPSKATAVSFAIALKLNLYETNMLLDYFKSLGLVEVKNNIFSIPLWS